MYNGPMAQMAPPPPPPNGPFVPDVRLDPTQVQDRRGMPLPTQPPQPGPTPPPPPDWMREPQQVPPYVPMPRQPMPGQGTNPRDVSSSLINKPAPFGGEVEKEGVPLWLKGFLQSPYAKWKGESEQAMTAPSPAPAFQPPMQMGQTHQQSASQMTPAPAWAQMSNLPSR